MKYLPLVLSLLLLQCTTPRNGSFKEQVTFDYAVVSVDAQRDQSTVTMTLTNGTSAAIDATNWAIYYSRFGTAPVDANIGAGLFLRRVLGDFWEIAPRTFDGLAPGESVEVTWKETGVIAHHYQLPVGVYIVVDGKATALEGEITPIDPSLINAQSQPSAASRWQENAVLTTLDAVDLPKVLPTPKSFEAKDGSISLTSLSFCAPEELTSTMAVFGEWLESELGLVAFAQGEPCNLEVSLDASLDPEGYQLSVSEGGIDLSGGSAAGVFYGLMSLLAAADIEGAEQNTGTLTVPYFEMQDEPAFGYRGFHLDVSRNFQEVATIKKLLKLMAFYKLNKFHFHLTDDEGWRVEIPELPELTSIGARRGHSEDELEFVLPAYGSGPDPDSPDNHGSGFYTQDELVDIIQYAKSLNIDVIPEIDLPGHARAAIKAMEARLLSTGEDTYRLAEPGDTSAYLSAQLYTDNVINVCQESTYDFVELVVDNIVSIYERADADLQIVHIGCDEVPNGVWVASPQCQELIAGEELLEGPHHLLSYFVSRVNDILKARGLRTAGWEEVVSDSKLEVAEDRSIIPYIWHDEELAYGLANAGYDVVLCNAANLYFDLAYNPDPAEPGLNWAGYVDTKAAFSLAPYHIGQSLDLDAATADQSILTSAGKRNIMGIQGQLWSETIRGSEALEYSILPKIFGLAQRAWEGDPEWGNADEQAAAWNSFVHQVAQRELPRLNTLAGGWNYRVPLPGIQIADDLVYANVMFPGLPIFYTSDGSEPTLGSQLYEEPIPYDASLKFKVIVDDKHQSRTVELR